MIKCSEQHGLTNPTDMPSSRLSVTVAEVDWRKENPFVVVPAMLNIVLLLSARFVVTAFVLMLLLCAISAVAAARRDIAKYVQERLGGTYFGS